MNGDIKDKWSLFSLLYCSLQENAEWGKSHCYAIETEYLLNRHRDDVIRTETLSIFCQDVSRQLHVYISTHFTSLTLSSGTCSEHSNNFDLTTGLNCVCLLRKHKDILQRLRSYIYLWEDSRGNKSVPCLFLAFVSHQSISKQHLLIPSQREDVNTERSQFVPWTNVKVFSNFLNVVFI